MDIANPLESIVDTYADVPMDFNSESDVQSRIVEKIREWLRQQNALYTPVTHGFDLTVDDKAPSYSQHYHSELKSTVNRNQLSRVRTEVPLYHPLDSKFGSGEPPNFRDEEEILDVAVLSRPFDRPIELINGKHRLSCETLDAAIEIKHPRDHICMPSHTRGKVDDLSAVELKDTVALDTLGIKPDLDELESFGSVYSWPCYFVLTSQYDILRRGSYTNQRHQYLADAAVDKIRDICDVTSVLYGYLDSWEWIIRN